MVGILQHLADDSKAGAQVLAATHSPYVLDFVPAEAVRVFGRRDNGHTIVAPLLSLPGVQERFAAGMTLGEMWFNTGEDRLRQGLLGAPATGE